MIETRISKVTHPLWNETWSRETTKLKDEGTFLRETFWELKFALCGRLPSDSNATAKAAILQRSDVMMTCDQ